MKTLSFASLFLIVTFAFSPIKKNVKLIDDPKQVNAILEIEEVILNQITCELENGNFCPLEIDKKEISIECSCEEAKMVMEPNLEALGKWDQEESKVVINFAHNYFKEKTLNITKIKFLKSKEQHYLFIQVAEKMMNNRFLFTIDK